MKKMAIEQQQYKIGDKIILRKGNNGNGIYAGKELTVYYVQPDYVSARTKEGNNFNIYTNTKQSGIADEVTYADRNSRIINLKETLNKKQKEIEELSDELMTLERFKSDEEEVAHKLNEILKASDKKNPVQAIAEVLKELKKSDML